MKNQFTLAHKRDRKPILFLISLLIITSGHSLCSQDAREIAEKASGIIEFESMEMKSTLFIHDNRGNVRERKVVVATREFGETTKTLLKFISPADVSGTTMLIYDYEDKQDDMWLYLPSLRRTRRIVSSEKGKSFMGSEFTNADMGKPNLNDFNYKLTGTSEIEQKNCWKIESVCKDENIAAENGFKSKIAYIEKNNYLTHKVEYYDQNNELFKIMTISAYKKQTNGKFFAYTMEVRNLQSNRRSVMQVDAFQLGSNLMEEHFSPTNLGK